MPRSVDSDTTLAEEDHDAAGYETVHHEKEEEKDTGLIYLVNNPELCAELSTDIFYLEQGCNVTDYYARVPQWVPIPPHMYRVVIRWIANEMVHVLAHRQTFSIFDAMFEIPAHCQIFSLLDKTHPCHPYLMWVLTVMYRPRTSRLRIIRAPAHVTLNDAGRERAIREVARFGWHNRDYSINVPETTREYLYWCWVMQGGYQLHAKKFMDVVNDERRTYERRMMDNVSKSAPSMTSTICEPTVSQSKHPMLDWLRRKTRSLNSRYVIAQHRTRNLTVYIMSKTGTINNSTRKKN